MQWFYNLKIAPKLILSFLIVLLLTGFLGVFSIIQLARVNQTSTDMKTNWMPSMRATFDMNTNIADFRMAELQHISSVEDEEKEKYEQAMAKVQTSLEKNRAEYIKLISTPEEQRTYDTFKMKWDEYLLEHDKVITLSRANDNAGARTMIRGASQQHFDEVSVALLGLIKLSIEGGQNASHQGEILYSTSRIWILSVLISALAVGLGLALFIARIVSRSLAQAAVVASTVAGGDLRSKIMVTTRDETGTLMQALKNMNDNLLGIVTRVRDSTDAMATVSRQIASGNSDLSQRTAEQASSLEETASSMEEMTSTVKQNAENSKQANLLALGARDVAIRGGEVVSHVVSTMASINDSSKKIVDIISVIEGIAFQTNILALNAAVEAARAGEQGRGFAVVANEVRTLAQRSATAAKDIKNLIGDSVKKVETGTKLVDQAGKTMDEIVSSIRHVADILGEISAASAEQSTGIDQVGKAIIQMDEVTQHNAALVEEVAAAAESLKEQAIKLGEVVGAFNITSSTHQEAQIVSLPVGRNTPISASKMASNAAIPTRIELLHKPAKTEPQYEYF